MKNILTYDDGTRERTCYLLTPQRLAQPGDVYRVVNPFTTLANKEYNVGDKLTIIIRNRKDPHNLISSLGNLTIKDKHFTSTWSCFDDIIARGWVQLVT